MSKRKKSGPDQSEQRIHLVESDVDHLPEIVIEPEEEAEDDIEADSEAAPTWDSVKDSIAWLRAAWVAVHGRDLAQSDLYAIMYTAEHKAAVTKYLEGF